MKKLGNLNPGAIFTFGKKQFVVLEQKVDGVFCLLAQSDKSVPFHDGDDVPRNNYIKSSLRREIEDVWLKELEENLSCEQKAAILKFDVDLRPTDQSEGYGTLEGVQAAPLTLWQYGKYKDIIPLNEDGWWWLVTSWACPWLRSPHTSNANNAWSVSTSGNCGNGSCSGSYGVRPALNLDSELLVSVEGDDEEDEATGEKDSGDIDLSEVGTDCLLREIARRIDAKTAGGEDECEAEG